MSDERELAHRIIDRLSPNQLVSLLAEMDDIEHEMADRYRDDEVTG